jgi:hypothetical protein
MIRALGLRNFSVQLNSCASFRAPQNSELEAVVVALVLEFRLRTGHLRWLERWRAYHPGGASQALHLYESSAHSSWVARSATAASIYDEVVSLFQGTR